MKELACIFLSDLCALRFTYSGVIELVCCLDHTLEGVIDRVQNSVYTNLRNDIRKRLRTEVAAGGDVEVLSKIMSHR